MNKALNLINLNRTDIYEIFSNFQIILIINYLIMESIDFLKFSESFLN